MMLIVKYTKIIDENSELFDTVHQLYAVILMDLWII